MTAVDRWVRNRVAFSWATLGLFLGDVTAIVVFVVTGELSHGIDPVAAAGYVVTNTLAPFLIGWIVVAVPAGMYVATPDSLRRVTVTTLAVWLGADVIAQAIRATPFVQGGASLRAIVVFGLVSFGVGGLLLVGWRVAVTVVTRRRSTVPA